MTHRIPRALARLAFSCVLPWALSCTQGHRFVVGLRSAGPFTYGMTLGELSRAVAETLQVQDSSCDEIAARAYPGISFMIISGHLERINVDTTDVPTSAGVTVGSTEADVRRAYPGIKTVARPYEEDDTTAHDLWVISATPADSAFGIVFETMGRVVTNYRAGRRPAVEYIEGCS